MLCLTHRGWTSEEGIAGGRIKDFRPIPPGFNRNCAIVHGDCLPLKYMCTMPVRSTDIISTSCFTSPDKVILLSLVIIPTRPDRFQSYMRTIGVRVRTMPMD